MHPTDEQQNQITYSLNKLGN